MLIDAHQHPFWHGRDGAGLLADMDQYGIDRAWLLTWEVLRHEDDRALHGHINPLHLRPDRRWRRNWRRSRPARTTWSTPGTPRRRIRARKVSSSADPRPCPRAAGRRLT